MTVCLAPRQQTAVKRDFKFDPDLIDDRTTMGKFMRLYATEPSNSKFPLDCIGVSNAAYFQQLDSGPVDVVHSAEAPVEFDLDSEFELDSEVDESTSEVSDLSNLFDEAEFDAMFSGAVGAVTDGRPQGARDKRPL